MKPNLKNRKNTIFAISIAAIVVIFFMLVYMPQHRRVDRMSKQIRDIDQQIALTSAMLGDIEKLGPLLGQMQQEMNLFEKKTPSKKRISNIISELTRLTQESSIEVVGIRPQSPIQVMDQQGSPVFMNQKPLESMVIEANLKAAYKALAEYLGKIQESVHMLASIKGIEIMQNKATAPRLDVKATFVVLLIDKD